MNGKTPDITSEELHAYVDGQLDERRMEIVARHLREHPDDAEMVAAWQQQNKQLKALYDPVFHEPLPFRPALDDLVALNQHRVANWQGVAASLATLIVGLLIGWFAHGLPDGRTASAIKQLADEAMNAHSIYTTEIRHPVEVKSGKQKHLIGWLSKRLGTRLVAPEITAYGFEFIGGRLLPASQGAAAQFMYENNTGHRLTLYITRNRSHQTTAFRFRNAGNYNAFYWLDEKISCAIVGELPRNLLKVVAKDIYLQLDG